MSVQLATVVDKYDYIRAFKLIGEALLGRCAMPTTGGSLPFAGMASLAVAAFSMQHEWYFSLFTRRMILRYKEPFAALSDSQYCRLLPPLAL
ncbi:hypothetical protein LTR95_019731, partial [Oleoguttula sp. CCFEE 5521]